MPTVTTSESDWTTTARDRTIAAIKAGRIDEALQGVEAMLEPKPADPRFLRRHVGDLLRLHQAEIGEAGVEKAWRYLGERLWKPLFTAVGRSRRRGAGRRLRDVPALASATTSG